MSVNAISSADAAKAAQEQQVVEKKSNMATIAGATIGTGAVGAAGGYFMKKTPSLDDVFAQKPDVFKATIKKAKDVDEESAKVLEDTLTTAQKAGASKIGEVQGANRAVTAAIDYQTVDNQAELQKAIDDAKKAYNEKKVKIGDKEYTATDIKQEVIAKRNAFNAATTDDTKKATRKALDDAIETSKKFKDGVEAEQKALMDAKEALTSAKRTKFEDLAKADTTEGKNAKKLLDSVTEKTSDYKKAITDKLDELKKTDTVKNAYEKVKGAFKEISWKNIGLYGGIAAAVGLAAAILLGKKSETPEA